MKQILEAYGKFLLDGVTVTLLFLLVFLKITGTNGNRGVLKMVGASLQAESEKEESLGQRYSDFMVYQAEGKKAKPVITFKGDGALTAGSHDVSDFIKAVDDAGIELPVKIIEIIGPAGKELNREEILDQQEIRFPEPGIYTMRVTAVDAANRKTISEIRLPVNRGGEP